MNISAYIKMNATELSEEIEKQKKKIKLAQETIKLLEKLTIAENAKTQNHNMQNINNYKTAHPTNLNQENQRI